MAPSAKDLVLRPIGSDAACQFIRAHHYSRKVAPNSQLHIGAFLAGKLEGVMQYGPSLTRRKMIALVEGTQLRQCLELNRMAFSEALPRNSESRAIAVSMKVLRKVVPHVKWVVSFADATQCGDGTIYRAAGFLLTGITENGSTIKLPSGEVIHQMTLRTSPNAPRHELGGRSFLEVCGGKPNPLAIYMQETGGEILSGYQLRYIKVLDPSWRERLTVEPLPYSAINEAGARMYRGQRLD